MYVEQETLKYAEAGVYECWSARVTMMMSVTESGEACECDAPRQQLTSRGMTLSGCARGRSFTHWLENSSPHERNP